MKKVSAFDVVDTAEGFFIHHNDVPLKTHAGLPFVVPTRALAERIAEEWRAAGDKPKPDKMPFTQLAATALDVIGKKRDEVVASLASYAASDLLCHRAEEPPELAAQQAELWQPWLDWAEKKYGAVLRVGQGIMPVAQPHKSLAVLRDAVAAYDIFHLAGLQQAAGVTGSLVLGLALAEGDAAADDVFKAAELESLFQMMQWGEDPVTTARHASLRRDLELCAAWFAALSV